MGRFFWPVLVSAAAIAAGLLWRYAPTLAQKLPDDVRERIVSVKNEIAAPLAAAISPQHEKPAPQEKTVRREKTPPREKMPQDRGVVRAEAAGSAAWCVLTHVTSVEGLDGKPIGNVAGGRFFLIDGKTRKTDGSLMFSGNFTPKKLPQTVRVAAKDVLCLTGTPENLSEEQKRSLRMYYQLNGDAEALKAKLAIRESRKNPWAVKAAEALAELRAKEAKARKGGMGDLDANRTATYGISTLRSKVVELNGKAKAWKAAHAAEFADPEKDPEYVALVKERELYADAIPGLAQ